MFAAQRKAGKTDKDAVQRKRLEDTVKEKQILFGGGFTVSVIRYTWQECKSTLTV